ncbi:MAG: hypothetical protein ABI822_15080 [Bryobacteraceae bacterium]
MNTILRGGILAAFLSGAIMAQPFGDLTAHTPPDPATMVANRVARLTTLLTLTTAQASQATTIFTNAQTAITPLQTSLSGYRTSLQAAVKSNSTAIIDQVSTSIGTATGQITAIQNKADAAFYAILTTAQQTTLNSAHMGGPGGGPGGFGRGPGGPGGFGRGPGPQ